MLLRFGSCPGVVTVFAPERFVFRRSETRVLFEDSYAAGALDVRSVKTAGVYHIGSGNAIYFGFFFRV